MTWRDRRERSWFGAGVLIAVGVIGLIANFDLVPRQYIEQLWKLWPVIPLFFGLVILARRRRYDQGHDSGGS